MGGSQKDLVSMLTATINAFNAHNLDGVMQHLDPAVNVFGIRSQAPHKGAALSRAFLEQSFNDSPNFTPLGQPMIVPSGDNITSATITGKATWTDKKSPQGEPLQFTFECAAGNTGNWLFTSVQGKVVP